MHFMYTSSLYFFGLNIFIWRWKQFLGICCSIISYSTRRNCANLCEYLHTYSCLQHMINTITLIIFILSGNELPHRQCAGLVCWRYQVIFPTQTLRFVTRIYTVQVTLRGHCQGLLQLHAWVSTKWSLINLLFSSLILIFHQYPVSKIHFYHIILQDSIFADTQAWSCRRPWHCPVKGMGYNCQLIAFTVSEAIVCSWLWSTVATSCPLGYSRIIIVSSS